MTKPNNTTRILGIDPGLNITGYAVLDFARGSADIVEAGAFRTDSTGSLADRISQIYDDLSELIAELTPEVAAIEELYSHYKHPRTSILMGHARGVILLACQQGGLDLQSIAATKVKKSLTGNGHASKEQVQMAVQSVFNLPEPPKPADVADAIAIALCAGRIV
ncbi:MAG TPA: crossover junction endodeoxyribonuclease RuvC, partial [Phycisphaerae bacterium]|nr:crossover junction endodeoxyribonuclease RuvC [Phycisphaerae bacterium]